MASNIILGGTLIKLEILHSYETNPFVDLRLANNGGGYSQMSLEGTYGSHYWALDDSSCGEFGQRIVLAIEDYLIEIDEMSDSYYVSQMPLEFKEIFKAVADELGYEDLIARALGL